MTEHSQTPAWPRASRIVVELEASSDRDNFAVWTEQTAALSWPSLVHEADRPHFAFSVGVSQFDAFVLGRTRLSHAIRAVRTTQDVTRTGLTYLIFQLLTEGASHTRCGGRDTHAGAGDIMVLDLAQPYETTVTACAMISFTAPREVLPAAMRKRDLNGMVVRPGHAPTDLLTGLIRSLDAAAADLTVEEGVAASRAVLLLAEAAMQSESEFAALSLDRDAQPVFDRASAYIEQRIDDPNLSAEAVADAIGVSRSTLYRIFEHAGGVRAYLRERRLFRSHELIASDLAPELSLAQIGERQGFGSEAHFGRAFKERFGISPGAARKAARARRSSGEPATAPPQTTGMPSQIFRTKKP